VVLYRRPIEARAVGTDELADLVHDVVVEEVAELLGLEPEIVDPAYGDGWDDGNPDGD
jgi:predicted Zn-dependent protease with MMP-like domain